MSEDGDRPNGSPAQRVARARQGSGLSRMALAERIGVRLFVIDRYEAGGTIPAAHLEAIAEATGHSLEWLRGEIPAETPPGARPRDGSATARQPPPAQQPPPAEEPPPARLRIAPPPEEPVTERTNPFIR